MLTKEELKNIKTLQELCEKEGKLQLKLNFDMLESRSEKRKEDFFHYEDGMLVGFLGSYYFGNKVEICGMVHPDYRRRGIFSKLLKEAFEEAKKREARTILLNAPTESQSAKEFLKNVPCTLAMIEYQMKWEKSSDLLDDPTVTVRPSISEEDFEAEIQLDVQCFGLNEKEARQYKQETKDLDTDKRLIIEAEGRIAGKMRLSEMNGESWIYGFSVFPELQGKGIGRKALSKVVKMQDENGFEIFLEVEAKNAHALGLYESCGFRSYHSQDYYKVTE
ncbi:GNAT family N-acetyltransferase [Neobacillus niacini]|uniref:GNAT family N-acetyltransferase n=1 Tax=Neobacillus niacini TaxID=86668 RepID=UPI00052F9AC6|nr:GNAT family N-acetyltransferase [Neobacillus niacini]KGM44976.1 GNAT family acetyltransferase [Neobacillus niacini]MEC1521060.1 GNAT family N-acetyltransferase [Neobacillus niacini]